MSALTYLTLTKLKNKIKDYKNHPAKLILSIIVIAIMGFVIITAIMNPTRPENLQDIRFMYAICLGLFGFVFILSGVVQGFSSGSTFFTMSDVNILFQTPLSSKKILTYGLIKQMTTSIFVGFFIFFQYSWLNSSYGITIWQMISVFLGYCIVFFCSSLTSMAIYTYTCNDDKKKSILKKVILGLFILVALYLFKDVISATNKLNSVLNAITNPVMYYIPVIGWMYAFVIGIITNNIILIASGLIATFIYIIAFIYIVSNMHGDYYEDVLKATEISYSAINAAKEGKINDTPKNVKVGKTGLKGGIGAKVFFSKHYLEDRRSGGFLLMDKNTLIFIASVIFFTIFMKNTGGIIAAFAFATYMQLLGSGLGRWVRELGLPYVYLIPDKPFNKLINLCKEHILKVTIESTLLFIIIGFITKASVVEVICCIIARISIGLVFMAGNILVQRLFGNVTAKGLLVMLYFLTLLAVLAPGAVGGGILAFRYSISLGATYVIPTITLCMLAWNIFISTVVTFLCKDILNYAELNNR